MKPFKELETALAEAQKHQQVAELLRQLLRVSQLVSKSKVREGDDAAAVESMQSLARRALPLREITHIIESGAVNGIDVISADLEYARQESERIFLKAIDFLVDAMKQPNLADIGSTLQIVCNLDRLGPCISTVLDQYLTQFQGEVHSLLSLSSIVGQKEGAISTTDGSTRLKKQVSGSGAAMRAGVWSRMESLLDALQQRLEDVFALQTVVEKKHDSVTRVSLAQILAEHLRNQKLKDKVAEVAVNENALSELNDRVLFPFWGSLLQTVKEELGVAARSSLVRSVLVSDFPRLFSLFSKAFQHHLQRYVDEGQRESFLDTVDMFRSEYLSDKSKRIQQMLQQMFASAPSKLPTQADVTTMLSAAAKGLLEVQEFPELLVPMLQNIQASMRLFPEKCADLVQSCTSSSPLLWSQEDLEKMSTIFYIVVQFDQFLARITADPKPRVNAPKSTVASPSMNPVRECLRSLGSHIVSPFLKLTVAAIIEALSGAHREYEGLQHPKRGDGKIPCSEYVHKIASALTTLTSRLNRLVKHPAYLAGFCRSFLRDVSLLISSKLSLCCIGSDQDRREQVLHDLHILDKEMRKFIEHFELKHALIDPFKLQILIHFSTLFSKPVCEVLDAPDAAELPAYVPIHVAMSMCSDLKAAHKLINLSQAEYWQWIQQSSEMEVMTRIQNEVIPPLVASAGISEQSTAVLHKIQHTLSAYLAVHNNQKYLQR